MKKILVVLGVLLFLLPTPAYAVLTFPDPDVQFPTITSVDVYNNYNVLGDQLWVANYYMKYSTANLTLMTLTIDQTFTGRILDAGGVELNNVNPYPYYSSGYEHGIFAMYFAAGSAPTWGSVNTVELVGAPIITWTGGPNPPSASTSSINWHATATVAAASLLLGAGVLQWATNLSNHWAVALTSQTADGVRLSTYGDQYFTNAIPGLRVACPQIYTAGIEVLQPTQGAPSTPPPSPYPGVWPWAASNAMFKELMFGAVLLVAIYYVGLAAGNMSFGVFAGICIIYPGIRLGMIDMTIGILMAIVCAILLVFTLVLNKGAV